MALGWGLLFWFILLAKCFVLPGTFLQRTAQSQESLMPEELNHHRKERFGRIKERSLRSKTMSTSSTFALPATILPLENGDKLTRVEFERRYEAMPDV